MWTTKAYGKKVGWDVAHIVCEKKKTVGYEDWRLPTNGEVSDLTLETKGERASDRVYIQEPFQLDHCVVWGTQDDGDSPWALFDFCEGEFEVYSYNKTSADLFCVRDLED